MGGALSGVFGHKKKADNPPPAAATPAATPGTVTTTDVTLMEMTTNTHDFSGEGVPSSVFQIPGGYKQVESPMVQMMNRSKPAVAEGAAARIASRSALTKSNSSFEGY